MNTTFRAFDTDSYFENLLSLSEFVNQISVQSTLTDFTLYTILRNKSIRHRITPNLKFWFGNVLFNCFYLYRLNPGGRDTHT